MQKPAAPKQPYRIGGAWIKRLGEPHIPWGRSVSFTPVVSSEDADEIR
jgi:hypothetical protein